MSIVTSQILKFVDSQKKKTSKYFEKETQFCLKIKKNHLLNIKGYIMAKKRFNWNLNVFQSRYKVSFYLSGCPFI